MVSIRIGQLYAYFVVFVMFIITWTLIVYALESFVNLVFTRSWFGFPAITTVPFDLPTPWDMMWDAIRSFPDFWAIGSVLFWGTVEEVGFIAYVLTGAIGAATGAVVFTKMSDFLKGVSETAGTKAGSS